jgi:hypothetical protein
MNDVVVLKKVKMKKSMPNDNDTNEYDLDPEMDEQKKTFINDYGLDEDTADTAVELMDEGLDEDEAAEIAEEL